MEPLFAGKKFQMAGAFFVDGSTFCWNFFSDGRAPFCWICFLDGRPLFAGRPLFCWKIFSVEKTLFAEPAPI